MLNIYLGDMENAIYHPPVYFDNTYEDEWITDELSVKMIKDIDKSDVIGPRLELSGGVKTLMLMAFDDSGKIFNASACGDNCAKWILRIAGKKNLTINLHHIRDFGKDFEAKILNTGEIVHSMAEFISVAGKYV